MTAFSKWIRLIAAFVSLGAAFALLQNAGLPERLAYSGYGWRDGASGSAGIGAAAPQLTLLRPDLSLYALQPDDTPVTVVNFWASWCQPCREELRQLQELHEAEPRLLRVVAINLGEGPLTVSKWAQDLGLGFETLIDPSQAAAEFFRVRGLPTTYLLDSEWRIQRIIYGAFSREQLLRAARQVSGT